MEQLSRADRVARGKDARAAAPLQSHADFTPSEMRDPVGLLLEQAKSRVPVRHGRMLVSPFTFYRGAALPMAADLAQTPASGLQVQLCGDAHLSNFGAFASPERQLVFDVNDFDETLPGPFEWDIKRLAASLAVAGRGSGFSGKDRRKIVLAAAGAYRTAMRGFAEQPFLDVCAWGPLSGLHINPAVTFGFTARGVFPLAWVVPYWVVQLGGAICAALFLQLMFGDVAAGGNYPIAKPGGEWRSLVMETVLTAILVSIILNTATGSRSIGHNAAIAVGSTVALLGLFASPISGASMNPARSLGPDIVSTDYTGWWVYVAGPVIGAAIAVAIIAAVRGLPRKEERQAAEGGDLPILGSPSGNGRQ